MNKQIMLGGIWITGFLFIFSINTFAQSTESTELKRYPDVSFRKVLGEDRWISAEDGCHRKRLESVISAARERKQVFEMLDLNGGDIKVGDFIQIRCGDKFWIAENGGGGKVLIEQNSDGTEEPTKFKILDILKRNADNDRTYIWVYLQTKTGELIAIPANGWIQANSHTPGSSADVIEIVIHKKYEEPKRDLVSRTPSVPNSNATTGRSINTYVNQTNERLYIYYGIGRVGETLNCENYQSDGVLEKGARKTYSVDEGKFMRILFQTAADRCTMNYNRFEHTVGVTKGRVTSQTNYIQ